MYTCDRCKNGNGKHNWWYHGWKLIVGIFSVISGLAVIGDPEFGIGTVLACIAIGAGFILWYILPKVKEKNVEKARMAAEAEARAAAIAAEQAKRDEEAARPWKCEQCGALTHGDICEYCGSIRREE